MDDKVENVVTARSFGMHGIVFDNTINVVQQLRCLYGDHVERAKSFLHTNRKNLPSVTFSGIVLEEVRTMSNASMIIKFTEIQNYSQLLIQEATGEKWVTI